MSDGAIRELSEADVKGMLLSVAWGHVWDEWRKEMHHVENFCIGPCGAPDRGVQVAGLNCV